MGTEIVPEMSENPHILTQLSAWENFIEFCCRENFKTVNVATSATVTTIIADADLNVSAVFIDEWT